MNNIRDVDMEAIEAVQAAIDELGTCFANIIAAAESLDAKLPGAHEASRRVLVQEIIQVARETKGKLSKSYQVCGLLARNSTNSCWRWYCGSPPGYYTFYSDEGRFK